VNRLADQEPDSQPPQPTLNLAPTSGRQLVVAALAGAVVGYFIIGTFELTGNSVPITPWSLPMTLVALAVAAAIYAVRLSRRVRDKHRDIDPGEGVRALVLGKTMLLSGAILLGGHLVYVGSFLGQLDIPSPRQRVIHGGVTVVLALAFSVAGWLLERACRVPDADDDT